MYYWTRRRLLGVLGAGTATGLAGCSGDGSDAGDDESNDDAEATSTPDDAESGPVETSSEAVDEPTPSPAETTSANTDSSASGVVFGDGFEDGLASWEVVADGSGVTVESVPVAESDAIDGAYQGESVVAIDASTLVDTIARARLPTASQPSTFRYAWWERSESFGGGARLLNGDGVVEIGTATDNPQWMVDGADGVVQIDSGTEYERWVETTLQFDWAAGTVDVTFRDTTSKYSVIETHSLKDGEDVQTIQLRAFTSGRGWISDSVRMSMDGFLVEG